MANKNFFQPVRMESQYVDTKLQTVMFQADDENAACFDSELAAGHEFDAVCEEMLRYHKHTHLLFSLESLANLARNGRVKPAVAAVARMLGIRVIGQASEIGELDVGVRTGIPHRSS